jgi:hypothetical protein
VDRVVLWLRRGVIALAVLVLMMWVSVQWAIESNASISSVGTSAAAQSRMAVQENWQCTVAVGPECILIKLLVPH